MGHRHGSLARASTEGQKHFLLSWVREQVHKFLDLRGFDEFGIALEHFPVNAYQ